MNKKNYNEDVDINNVINYLSRLIIDFNDCSLEFGCNGFGNHIEY